MRDAVIEVRSADWGLWRAQVPSEEQVVGWLEYRTLPVLLFHAHLIGRGIGARVEVLDPDTQQWVCGWPDGEEVEVRPCPTHHPARDDSGLAGLFGESGRHPLGRQGGWAWLPLALAVVVLLLAAVLLWVFL